MTIGDLVRGHGFGIIGVVTYINGHMYQVIWTNGEYGHHYDYNLEVLNESR